MADYVSVPLNIPPGVDLTETETASDRWVYAQNIRFYRGKPQIIGGWGSVAGPLTGTPRTMFYYEQGGNQWLIIGTSSRLYALKNVSLLLYNITPLQTSTTAIANSLDATNASTNLVVNAASHGMSVGDRVKIAGATGFAGISAGNINKEHIVTAATTNTFTVVLASAATSTVTGGGGASTTYQKQISISDAIWSFDKFNEDVVMTPGNLGGVYKWSGDTDTAPTLITNAPTQANFIFVSLNKLCVLGAYSSVAGNQRDNRLKNSNSGDYTDWTLATASQAFEQVYAQATKFIAAVTVGARTYLFTKGQIFYLDDIGGDDVWRFGVISRNVGLLGQNAVIEVDGVIYFLGKNGPYYIIGDSVRPLPNNTLREWYVGLRSILGSAYSCVRYVEEYNEIYFHFSSGTNPNFAMIYSITEGHYTPWQIDRTCGINIPALQSGQFNSPYACDSGGYVYRHEIGYTAEDVALEAQLKSNYVCNGQGDDYLELKGLEPDFKMEFDGDSSVQIIVNGKDRPMEGDPVNPTELADKTLTHSTEKVDYLATARYRQLDIRITASANDDSLIRLCGLKEFFKKGGKS